MLGIKFWLKDNGDIRTDHLQYWLSSRNFFRGESTVIQISFVMLIFPLFSDQTLGGGQSLRGGQTASGGTPAPPSPWKKARIFIQIPLFEGVKLMQNVVFF